MNPLHEHEQRLLKDVQPCSMCELGAKKNARGTYKQYFVGAKFKHVSIDLNGTGDLKLDLQQPIDVEAIGGPFDIVTNFGTTEHVDNQEACWRNVHALLRKGGDLISTTPLDWPGHGRWYPSAEWFEEFGDLNGYHIKQCFTQPDRLGYHTLCIRAYKRYDVVSFTMPSIPIFEMPGGKVGAYET